MVLCAVSTVTSAWPYSVVAAVEDAVQVVHGLAVARHRPRVALRHHARHVLFGLRLAATP